MVYSYQFSGNTPIQATDLDGLEEHHYTLIFDRQGKPQLQHIKTVNEKSFLFFSWKPLEKKIITYEEQTFEFTKGGYSTSPANDWGTNSFDNLEGWMNDGYQQKQFGQAFYSTQAKATLEVGMFMEGASENINVARSWAKANPYARGNTTSTTTNKQAIRANNGNGNAAAANANASQAPSRTILYHYTNEEGQNGILSSQLLKASTKASNPNGVRYGDGQYLSDIVPGSKTPAQLSRAFLNVPYQGQKFTHYVAIDVTGLNVVKGRNGVYVIPNSNNLDIKNRIVGKGQVQPSSSPIKKP